MGTSKILLVDDEPYNRDYLEQELADRNHELIQAVNGQDALEKVRSDAPDLILLDIMMPVMDGFEMLRHLKENPATRDIPVIVISANNDLKSVVKGIQLGAEDYLPKPFEPVLLHARIDSSLEKKRLRDIQHLYLKSLERELDIAREIQHGFLPGALPEADGWGIAAYFQAAREVAGDFYDAFLLPDGKLAIVVGDVCDKGVGAALFMTLFRSLIRITSTSDHSTDRVNQAEFLPKERLQHIASYTNNYIANTHGDANMFATAFIGILNVEDGTLAYVNCGNEPPLVLKNDGSVDALPPTGPVLGAVPDADFSVKEITLQRQESVFAFTDGVPDALNADGVPFGKERLLELLTPREQTPDALIRSIEETVHRFIGGAEQFDDITLLAIQRNR
jgi:serine phosphatase RsbU (regulator of sigma subunit)